MCENPSFKPICCTKEQWSILEHEKLYRGMIHIFSLQLCFGANLILFQWGLVKHLQFQTLYI